MSTLDGSIVLIAMPAIFGDMYGRVAAIAAAASSQRGGGPQQTKEIPDE
jgi:hypothetical protein